MNYSCIVLRSYCYYFKDIPHTNILYIMSFIMKQPWHRFITPDNQHLVSEDAMKFLDGLLK